MTSVKTYTSGDVVIRWDAGKCVHSGICARELPSVFKPRERPWIQMDGAEAQTIVAQVLKCPSGALSLEPKP